MKRICIFLMSLIFSSIALAHTLRVGTTGDYPPVSIYNPQTQQYSGTEIAIIQAFAKAQGWQVEFVKTTWPTLSQDLLHHRFNIAVGGISADPPRAKLFLFTTPIEYTGKVPLVRCADISHYQNIASINQPAVTVVENKGGTNQSFAQQFLPKSHIVMVSNNASPFEYLLSKRADVMITDSTEATYRQQTMPGLCAVNPTRFLGNSKAAKVFLIPKTDGALQKRFNHWWKEETQKPHLQSTPLKS